MAKQIPDLNRMESLRKELGFKDPGIFEKSVYAFNLLSELLRVYPGLIFKGGTAILLHIFPPVRLSIDIDILLPVKEEAGLKDALGRLVSASKWFDAVKEDTRHSKIPKAHYKFHFASQFSKIPQYVLLDVVFTEHPYKKLVEKDISKIPMVFSDSDVAVRVPTPEGLVGDKITAVSPKTTGIPLNKKRAMEVLKQVIDLGELFKVASDVADIRQSFLKTAEQENGFRKTDYSVDEILDDVTDLAFKYSQSLLKGADNSFPEIALINDGLNKVGNHLRQKINPQDLKIAFARIAYTARVLKERENQQLIKKVDMSLTQGLMLPEKYKILEKLKTIIPEAYFYWALAVGTKHG
ncbi:MAG: nucleotidyl transferase AbiEii/AbiGii toxin family protein [Candidatus Omnitrophica bacterium]|nr:nucleotidyl transferase AbiEii/AbiGii toxin family protein [Candidatus Omnitrophota bacterium]MBU4488607.1 nucleotidyl transferase AbiEii/AbiGii toxin family protein [Candidatus Omnitrophota bacterium]MCG2705914.1 nucleotidyl transferase AbiEii/AbiGii toxin family protein [Candidatus Omnitrophota bacterium]